MRQIKGFTLIELLAVIGIIGILAAIGIPSLLSMYNPLKRVATMVSESQNTAFIKAKTDGRVYCLTPLPKAIGLDRTIIAGFSYDLTNPPDLSLVNTTSISNFQNTLLIRLEPTLDIELPSPIIASSRSSCTQTRFQETPLEMVPSSQYVYMATSLVDNYLVIKQKQSGSNPYISALLIVNAVGQSTTYYYKNPAGILLPNY